MTAKWWKARGVVRVRSDSNTEMRKILRASRVGWYRSIARTIGRPSGRGRIRHDQYEGKAEVARARGATAAFLYEGGLFADKVRDVTNGRGVDVIFDPVGKPTFRDSLRATRLGTLAKRMREQGQICCLCRLPLAPPHPMAERLCAKCSAPHRVYLHASNYSNFWFVQLLEEDLRTSI